MSGGQMVRMLALYSNDPSSNQGEVNSFYSARFLKELKRGWEWPIKKLLNGWT